MPFPTDPWTSSLIKCSLSTAPLASDPLVPVLPSIRLFLCLCRLCMRLCIQMYPALPISHIEESKRPVTIHSWCKKGWGHCQPRPFIVIPYRCLGKNSTTHCHRITEKSGLYIVILFLCVPIPFFSIFEGCNISGTFHELGDLLYYFLLGQCRCCERTNTLDFAYTTAS